MPSLPTRTTDIQTYKGEKIVCAKFQTYEADTAFKFTRVAYSNGDFQFQMVAKANANATVKVVLGGVEKEILLTAGFQLKKESFSNLDVSGNSTMLLIFPAGTFWLYHLQLEEATSPSDWRPAPEDSSDYADEVGQESYTRAQSYADMTAEQKAEAAVAAQTQESIFNKLTNNGQVQGMYLENGRVYINASYIRTGTLSIKKDNLETFYANADTGVIRIVADEFSLSNGKTLDTTLQAAKSYAESQDAINLENAEAFATQEATQKSAAAVNAQTQASIFNKLTNNGQTQGIYLSGGKIYINASYIHAGTLTGNYIAGGILADATGNMSWNLETGKLTAKKLSIDSTYFKLTEDGAITATSGSFDNITVKSGCNLSPVSNQVVTNAKEKVKEFAAEKITADYIIAKVAVLGALSARENGIGVSGGVYSSGTITAPYVYASTRYDAVGGNGQTVTVSLKDPNGNTAATLGFSGGILVSTGGNFTFACTKMFKYTKSAIRFWAYESSTASSKTYFNQTFVSDISTASGSYTITM